MKIKMNINRWRSSADVSVIECEPMYAGSMYVHHLSVEANLYENEVLQAEFRVGGKSVAQASLLYKESMDEQFALYEALIPSKLFKTSAPKQIDVVIGLFKSDNGVLNSILVTQPQSFTIEGEGHVFENDMDTEEREHFNENLINLTGKINGYEREVSHITEKLNNFKIGSVTAQSSECGEEAEVTAEIANKSEPNEYELNLDFTLPRGEKGEAAGFGTVTAKAETGAAGSVPQASVSTSGTNASKNFAFSFKIPKGDAGTPGQDGLDGAAVFTLKRTYDADTTKIPASDVEIPFGRNGRIHEYDMLLDGSGNVFRVIAGNSFLNNDTATVKFYSNIKGDIGPTPDITINATVDDTVGTPSVTVTKDGTQEAPEINLSFHNLKGEKGDALSGVMKIKGNAETDYRQGNVNLKSSDIGSVARDTFFLAHVQPLGSYVKVFKSGYADYEWDTISLTFVVSDVNANNMLIGTAGYRLTYRMRGDQTPLFNLERIFGVDAADSQFYINFNNTAYSDDNNYFEIYYKVGYEKADDSKSFQVLNYSNRRGDINDFEQYTGTLTAEENPTSLGAFDAFKTYVKTSFLDKNLGGTMTGRLNLNADGVYVNDGVNNQQVVWAKDDGDGGNYGCELFVEGRGNTFVGSGESPHNLNNELQAGNLKKGEQYGRSGENFYISSDSNIFFNPNCNTIGNRGVVRLDNASLSMYSQNVNKWVRFYDDRLDMSAAPTATQYNGLEIFDKNDNYVSNFRFMNTPEYKATQMTIRNSVNGTIGYAGVEVAMYNNGTSYFRPYGNSTTDLGDSTHRWKEVHAVTIVPTLLYSTDSATTGEFSISNGPFSRYNNIYMVIGGSSYNYYGSIYSMNLGLGNYWNIDGVAANYASISVKFYNDNVFKVFTMRNINKIRLFGF